MHAQDPTFRWFTKLMFFCSCLGSLSHFEQGDLPFHFALGPPNDVASPVLALDTGPVGQDCAKCEFGVLLCRAALDRTLATGVTCGMGTLPRPGALSCWACHPTSLDPKFGLPRK